MKEAKQKKLNNKIHVIPSERSKQFIENFNKNKPTEEFIESCKKARELFGVENDKSTDQNVADVPSGDLISRADAIEVGNKIIEELSLSSIDWDDLKYWAKELFEALPSADRPTLKQTDTMIIADALRYLIKDTERHELDRTRAEELREQILKYGASMCHSADRPQVNSAEWVEQKEREFEELHRPDYSYEADMVRRLKDALSADRPKGEWIVENHEIVCSVCGQNNLETNFCPNCGADMRPEK